MMDGTFQGSPEPFLNGLFEPFAGAEAWNNTGLELKTKHHTPDRVCAS
jgi:hypothetical protein